MTTTIVRPSPEARLGPRHAARPVLRDRPLPPLDDVTRRDLLRGAAALLVVAGCGTDRQPVAAPSPTAATRTIEHKYGSTEISGVPERVVSVGLIEQDALLALGVVPVATREWFGEYPGAVWPWSEPLLGDEPMPEVLAFELDFEKIAALEPDVIVGLYSGLTENEYDTLSQIAPTVAQPGDVVDYGIGWQELTRTVGQIVGQEEQTEAMIGQIEDRFAQVRDEHPAFVGASAVMATPFEGISVYGRQDARGRLLEAMGFEIPGWVDEVTGEEFYGNVSAERAELLDIDVIIWLDADQAEGPLGGPLYESLAVHEEGREVFLSSDSPIGGATSFVTVASIPFLLDELVPLLEAAVDGDPATEPTPASS